MQEFCFQNSFWIDNVHFDIYFAISLTVVLVATTGEIIPDQNLRTGSVYCRYLKILSDHNDFLD